MAEKPMNIFYQNTKYSRKYIRVKKNALNRCTYIDNIE
jgi:hypothetical protein